MTNRRLPAGAGGVSLTRLAQPVDFTNIHNATVEVGKAYTTLHGQ
jgi:hypothetical protein